MATTAIKLQTSINKTQRSINIKDITDWETNERESRGFAVFLIKDGSVIDGSLKDFTFDEWTFELTSEGEYTAVVYSVGKHSNSFSYNEGDIVIAPPAASTLVAGESQWMFYISEGDGNTGNNPADDDGSNWTEMTDLSTSYTQFAALSSHGEYTPISEMSYQEPDDLEITAVKTACKEFAIDNPGSTVYYDIYDFENYIQELTPLNGSTRVQLSAGETNFDLDTYSVTDGIYVFVFYETDSSEDIIGYLVIYEYCEIKACFKSLMEDVLCCTDQECDDAPCLGSSNYNFNMKYREAMRIQALFFTFIGYTFSEETKYLYMTTMSEDRKDLLNRANQVMIKLKELTERCGSC
jgi:hypothetical protein